MDTEGSCTLVLADVDGEEITSEATIVSSTEGKYRGEVPI